MSRRRRNGRVGLGSFWADPERSIPTTFTSGSNIYLPVGIPLTLTVDNSGGPVAVFRVTIQYWDNDAGAVKDASKVFKIRSGTSVNLHSMLPFISSNALPTAVGDTAMYIYAIPSGYEYSYLYAA